MLSDDDEHGFDDITVGLCTECGAQTTALTASGRCLLCRKNGEALHSLGNSSGERRTFDDNDLAPPPPPPMEHDLEAGDPAPSPTFSIASIKSMRSIRSIRSARSERAADRFASEGSVKDFGEDGGNDTDEESWAEVDIDSPVPTSGKKVAKEDGAKKSERKRDVLVAIMALGGLVLAAGVVVGAMTIQGKIPGFGRGSSGANSALEVENDNDEAELIGTTAVPVTTATIATSTTGIETTSSTRAATSSTSADTSESVMTTSTAPTLASTTDPNSNPGNTSTPTATTSSATETTSLNTEEMPTTATTTTTTAPNTTMTTTPATNITATPTTTSITSTTTTSTSTTTEVGGYFPSEPVPLIPPPGYFNYNTSDLNFGPSAWGSLNTTNGLLSTPEYVYWSQFREIKYDLTKNKCGTGVRQSPIDVRMDAIRGYRPDNGTGYIHLPERGEDIDGDGDLDEYEEGICYEHHEIRTRGGRLNLQSDIIIPQILPNKLRLVYDGDAAAALSGPNSTFSPLPSVDFPHQWGGAIDLKHIDVHIPSQHKVEGKEFPAEYQLWHLHPGRRKAAVVSIMVDVHPQNKRNNHFQRALVEWQKVWEKTFHQCQKMRRTGEAQEEVQEEEGVPGMESNPFALKDEDQEVDTDADRLDRQLSSERWDPYDPKEIKNSIHFYGYSGSLTEPPCTERFVEWHIMDKPMLISETQLRHLKYLLFLYQNDQCQRTSTHYEGRAARRPMRNVTEGQHSVHRCTCHDFLSDEERRSNANVTRCTRKEEQEEIRESLNSFL